MIVNGDLKLPEERDFWLDLGDAIEYNLNNNFIPANEEDAWYDYEYKGEVYSLHLYLEEDTEDGRYPNAWRIRAVVYRDYKGEDGLYWTDTNEFAEVEI